MGRGRDSRSRSPPRRDSRRDRRDSRSRSRGRGGDCAEWGTSGEVVELKNSGIGFIRPHTGKVDDKDLFFHSSGVKGNKFDDLQIGDEVEYETEWDNNKGKPKAIQIVCKSGGGRRGGGGGGGRKKDSR